MLRSRYSPVQDRAALPRLVEYVTIGGAVLLWLFTLLNSVLQPSGPKPSTPPALPEAVMTLKPQASSGEPVPSPDTTQAAAANSGILAAPAGPVIPYVPPIEPEEPAQVQTSGSVPTTTATPGQDEAARAARLARKKMQAERARKQRLARERARAQEQAASRQQTYGYAPQPTFGPFGGWGQPQRW